MVVVGFNVVQLLPLPPVVLVVAEEVRSFLLFSFD